MGGVKKAIKRVFGGGSSQSAPQVQQVAPAVQAVQSADTSADTANAETKKKKRQGFASTAVATDAMTAASDEKKNTLG